MTKLLSKKGSTLVIAIVMMVIFSILGLVVVNVASRTANSANNEYWQEVLKLEAKNFTYECIKNLKNNNDSFFSEETNESFDATYDSTNYQLVIKLNGETSPLYIITLDTNYEISEWRNN